MHAKLLDRKVAGIVKGSEEFDEANFIDASENIKDIKELIPNDVKNIVEIGCGSGLITSELMENYEGLGVDRSKNALAFLKTKKKSG